MNASVTIFAEGIETWTAFTFRKTILNFLDKLSEKTLTLFAFSLKILKTLIMSISIMWVRICQRKSFEDFLVSAGKKNVGFRCH